MTLDRTAARARCVRASNEAYTMRCLTGNISMVIEEDLPAALDELDAKDAEIERLREVWDELAAIKANYGDECDHMLTRDAIDLKQAINRIWEELERMCPGAMAALEGRDCE